MNFLIQHYNQYSYRRRLSGLILALFCFACGGPKDYILMIDTSASMVFGERVMEKVKAGIDDFIDDLDVGDTITVMGFDTVPRLYKTYTIKNEKDKKHPIQKVLRLQAKGAYTDMGAMLNAIRKQSKKLQAEGRQLYIVVMSDGLDDPPPSRRNKKYGQIQLDFVRGSSSFFDFWNEPYVYYVSLGKLKDKKLVEKLQKLSTKTKSIQAGPDGTAALKNVSDDINRSDWYQILLVTLAILSALLLVALLVLFAYYLMNRHRLQGVLVYYDEYVGKSMSETFNMQALQQNRLLLGRKPQTDCKVRGFGIKFNLTLRARFHGNEMCLKPKAKEWELYEFEQLPRYSNLIAPGEKFKVGGFVFHYKVENSAT